MASDQAYNITTAIDRHLNAQIAALKMLAASPLVDDPSRWNDLYIDAQGFRQNFEAQLFQTQKMESMSTHNATC